MPLTKEQAKRVDREVRKLRELIHSETPEKRPPAIERLYGVLAMIELLEGDKK